MVEKKFRTNFLELLLQSFFRTWAQFSKSHNKKSTIWKINLTKCCSWAPNDIKNSFYLNCTDLDLALFVYRRGIIPKLRFYILQVGRYRFANGRKKNITPCPTINNSLLEWAQFGCTDEILFPSTFHFPFTYQEPNLIGKSIWTWSRHSVINAVVVWNWLL